MTSPAADVILIGAGVSGLTTAVGLAEAGNRVQVFTDQPPLATTSAAAGAMWGPYLVEPRDKVRQWAATTLAELRHLAGSPETGVRLVSGIEASRVPRDPPDWSTLLPDFTLCDAGELPPGFTTGWRATVPLIDMPVYLAYLSTRLRAAGGHITTRHVPSLYLHGEAPVVVNCSGLGASTLVPDRNLTPIRGQLVTVENPGITEYFTEDTGTSSELLHIYPHGDHVVLGGTAEPGRTDLEPDPATADRIIDRCAAIAPQLRTATVVAHRVGLRPTRPRIRVDETPTNDRTRLLHNYGHGGAGVSLSWGCAFDIRARLNHAF